LSIGQNEQQNKRFALCPVTIDSIGNSAFALKPD